MIHAFPITLAAIDVETIVVWGLIIAGVFGSWIMNAVKKVAEQREAQRQRERGLASTAGTSSDAGPDARARALAAQRREQLREQVRQRAQVHTPGSDQPQNMTMAERIARARAKQQYAQRTTQLHEQSASSARRPVDPDQARREALRRAQRQAEHEARQRMRREADLLRRRQLAQRQAQHAQTRARARAQTPAHRREPVAQVGPRQGTGASAPRPVAQPAASRPSIPTTFNADRVGRVERLAARASSPSVRRSPATSASAATPTPVAMRPIGQWSTRTMRQALIMKEIFDKPVALRDPITEGLL